MRRQEFTNPMPNDAALEEGTLNAIAQLGGPVMDECKILLTPDHFYFPHHQIIFRVMRRLMGDDKPINTVTVAAELRRTKQLETAGGSALVERIIGNRTPLASIRAYCEYVERLEELLKRRKAAELALWITGEAHIGTGDSTEFVAEIERRAFEIGATRTVDSSTQLALSELKQQIKIRRDIATGDSTATLGILTGLPPWDGVLGGIFDERMYVIAARPGEGKTSAIEQAMTTMLRNGYPVLVFEKDMPRSKLIGRMACRLARVSFYAYERGWLKPDELDRMETQAEDLANAKFYIYDPTRLTGEDIHAIVRREKRKNGIAAWFLDHVQLLDTGDDMRVSFTRHSLAMKRCINDTGVPGIVVAQLNRKGADTSKGRPTAAQIKEFDQLNADAGVVIILYTDMDRLDLSAGEPILVNWLIDKNNFGITTEENCWFNGNLMEFYPADAPRI